MFAAGIEEAVAGHAVRIDDLVESSGGKFDALGFGDEFAADLLTRDLDERGKVCKRDGLSASPAFV